MLGKRVGFELFRGKLDGECSGVGQDGVRKQEMVDWVRDRHSAILTPMKKCVSSLRGLIIRELPARGLYPGLSSVAPLAPGKRRECVKLAG